MLFVRYKAHRVKPFKLQIILSFAVSFLEEDDIHSVLTGELKGDIVLGTGKTFNVQLQDTDFGACHGRVSPSVGSLTEGSWKLIFQMLLCWKS